MLLAIAVVVLIRQRWYNGWGIYDYLTLFMAICLAHLMTRGIGFIRNRDKPFFEIREDVLIYKGYWSGSIREYPLKNFSGKIETKRVLFQEQYLKAPKLTELGVNDTIYIGMLRKKDRESFLECLRKQVSLLENE